MEHQLFKGKCESVGYGQGTEQLVADLKQASQDYSQLERPFQSSRQINRRILLARMWGTVIQNKIHRHEGQGWEREQRRSLAERRSR